MEAKESVVFFYFKILDRLLGVFLVLKTCRADTRGTIGTFTILYGFQFSTNSWNSFFLNCPLFPRYYHMTTPQDLKLFLTGNSGMLKYAKFDTFYYTQPQNMQQPRINKFFFFFISHVAGSVQHPIYSRTRKAARCPLYGLCEETNAITIWFRMPGRIPLEWIDASVRCIRIAQSTTASSITIGTANIIIEVNTLWMCYTNLLV